MPVCDYDTDLHLKLFDGLVSVMVALSILIVHYLQPEILFFAVRYAGMPIRRRRSECSRF